MLSPMPASPIPPPARSDTLRSVYGNAAGIHQRLLAHFGLNENQLPLLPSCC